MKKIVAACIDRILEFDTPQEAKDYLDGMRNKGSNFRLEYDVEAPGGKRRIRIKEQYNKAPMITD